MKKTIRFVKLMNRWFADLPKLANQIDVSDCEMVAGADTMLDALSNGRNEVRLVLSTENYDTGYVAGLIKIADDCDYGINYNVSVFRDTDSYIPKTVYSGNAWLCPVTAMVFGKYPDYIYIYEQVAKESFKEEKVS